MKTEVQEAIIKRWIRGKQIVRAGRGYSKAELEEVGLHDVRSARVHGIAVDPLRSTNYSENVDQLRGVAKTIIESRKIDSSKAKSEKRDSKKRTKVKPPTTKNKKSRKKTLE